MLSLTKVHMKRWFPIIFFLFFGTVILYMSGLGYLREHKSYESMTAKTSAIIASVQESEMKTRNGGDKASLNDGLISYKFNINSKEYLASDTIGFFEFKSFKVGDQIVVRYHRSNPQINSRDGIIPILLSGFIIVPFIGFIFLCLAFTLLLQRGKKTYKWDKELYLKEKQKK